MAQTLAAFTKIVFGKPFDVLPEDNQICAQIPFKVEERTGNTIRVPLRMADEQGFTYSSTHAEVTIEDSVAGDTTYLELEGSEIIGQASIPYGEMSKLSESNSETKQAFMQAVGEKIESTTRSAERRRELAIMYGPGSAGLANLGVIKTVVSDVTTTLVVDLTRASFAPGLWNALLFAKFDIYDGSSKLNADSYLQLTGVNQSAARLTFTGDESDIDAVAAAGADSTIVFRGSRASSCVGIQAIMENTGALFGPSAATYPLWKAYSHSVGGPLTFDKVAEGLTQAADNGAEAGGKLYMTSRAWTDCMTDEAALRRHLGNDAAAKAKVAVGYKKNAITFDTVAGPVQLLVHKFQKQGQAWFIAEDAKGQRAGSRDVSFKLPGQPNEWMFHESGSTTASKIRCYGDQAIFFRNPSVLVNFTGIESTSDVVPA